MRIILPFIWVIICCLGCKQTKESSKTNTAPASEKPLEVKYAQSFTIASHENGTLLTITKPWPQSDVTYRYLLTSSEISSESTSDYDAVLRVPLQNMVVTSTTHIPSLEMLGEEEKLLGFPNLNYISSEKTRALIDNGTIKELGKNESLNTEVLIDLNPEAVITFAVEGQNTTVATLQKTGIPVLYNADWTETHPLGKAEWIKFFGVLLGKEQQADSIFSLIEKNYTEAKAKAKQALEKPTVLSGAMFRDVWYLPQGESWAAQFIEDAHGEYLWKDTQGTGSLSLNLESVLEKGQNADFWIGPGQFHSYTQLKEAHAVYSEFRPFQEKNVFTFTAKKGATGGVVYYELAPNRPDLVLKDLIKIMHPTIYPEHPFTFFEPLQE